MTVPPRPEIRISDADRERAAARLRRAMSEGRITMVELEERLAVVYAARFATDLLPPFEDLPGDPRDVLAEVPLTTSVGPPTVLRTGMGALRRVGQWRVPARIRVQSTMGPVLLDFTEADLTHPVVEIELELGAGPARIMIPDGGTADVEGLAAGIGMVRNRVEGTPGEGPHFRIYGRAGLGSVVIRRRYRIGALRI